MKKQWLVGSLVVLIVVVAAMVAQSQRGKTSAVGKRQSSATQGAVKTFNEAKAVAVAPRHQGLCSAVLPTDWVFVPGRDGSNVEAYTPNRSVYAGWIIRAINPAMRPYYGDMYGPPDAANANLIQAVTHMPTTYTSGPKESPYFTIRNFQSGQYTGTVLYKSFPAPFGSAPGSYILSTYVVYAAQGQQEAFKVAQAVLTTLRCTTALHPPSGGSPGGSRAGSKSANDELKDYNAQTGKQYAYSPSTGKNYLLDATTDWNANGPDGPGYYRSTGSNSCEKLELGWH